MMLKSLILTSFYFAQKTFLFVILYLKILTQYYLNFSTKTANFKDIYRELLFSK